MAEGRLAPAPISNQEHYVSAPSSADFSYNGPYETTAQESISDILLDSDTAESHGEYISAIFPLRDHMGKLLNRYRERYDRNSAAADYAGYYRDEIIDTDESELTCDEKTALLMGRVYLSTIETLGQLGKFIETNKWLGHKSEDAEAAKVVYLASRKKFQNDVDDYFEYFKKESSETLYTELVDTVNLARLTIRGEKFINAETDNHTHVFLGSVLSERAVMVSLKQHVHPEARYGTEDEDKSPTKADVVFPIKGGDMYVQVKMKWQKETHMKVQPKKKPPHVVVPMQYIRGNLTADEHAKLAEIISAAAERKTIQLQIDQALALSGIKKYVALMRVPMKQLKDWWNETKDVVRDEPPDNIIPLQSGVDELESIAA